MDTRQFESRRRLVGQLERNRPVGRIILTPSTLMGLGQAEQLNLSRRRRPIGNNKLERARNWPQNFLLISRPIERNDSQPSSLSVAEAARQWPATC